MITLRKSTDRGHFNHGWLDTYHSFSFDQYYDPKHMGFRHLRVINEDRVQPGAGFPTHPHRNMEIITFILEGALEHRDSIGNTGVIRPGEVQKMSAGRGITHSEFNASPMDTVHLLQIWIVPEKNNIEPCYEQVFIDRAAVQNKLVLFGSRNGGKGVVTIYQDVNLYVGMLTEGNTIDHKLHTSRHAWIQIARGTLTVNGQILHAGDGVAISGEETVTFETPTSAEFLLFDMS